MIIERDRFSELQKFARVESDLDTSSPEEFRTQLERKGVNFVDFETLKNEGIDAYLDSIGADYMIAFGPRKIDGSCLEMILPQSTRVIPYTQALPFYRQTGEVLNRVERYANIFYGFEIINNDTEVEKAFNHMFGSFFLQRNPAFKNERIVSAFFLAPELISGRIVRQTTTDNELKLVLNSIANNSKIASNVVFVEGTFEG